MFEELPDRADKTPLDSVLEKVASTLRDRNAGRSQSKRYQAMILAENREHAAFVVERWAQINLGDVTIAVHHGSSKQSLSSYKKNCSPAVLVVVQMLKEGFNHPPVSVVAIVRRVGSPLLFTQFIGRSFRLIRKGVEADPDYNQVANIISAAHFRQQANWEAFKAEKLIPLRELDE